MCFVSKVCISHLVGFFEPRLLRDEEEVNKRLDNFKWHANLEAFSVLLVDRTYMGAFVGPDQYSSLYNLLTKTKLEAIVSGKVFLLSNKGGARSVS